MGQADSLVLVVSGRLDTCSGGYEYDRRILEGLRGRGWTVDVRELDDSFPQPTSAALDHAAAVLAAIPSHTTVLVDGLALGAMPEQVEHEADRLRLIALVHHPLAHETGIDAALAARFVASERRALAAVARVVVTSKATASSLVSYDVLPHRVEVVEPGTDPAPVARGSGSATVHLIAVGTLIPRKGYDVLFRALAALPQRNWHLTCAGSLDRDSFTVGRLRAQLRDDGLDDRVLLAGELNPPTLARHYEMADLFVLPTLYEGYGMAVAEALARGLPVVSTATGGIAELVGEDAGVIVPAGDVGALSAALGHLIGDAAARARLAAGARRVRGRLPTWADAADNMATALTRVSGDGTIQR
jgi:glycosyltransferase involved in cell wall biosynthesis